MGEGVGLVNMSNTCYINAIIQCLKRCDKFVEVTHRFADEHPFAGTLFELFTVMNSQGHIDAIRPVKLVQTIWASSQFRAGFPEDAHELLLYIVHHLHDVISKPVRLAASEDPFIDLLIKNFHQNYGNNYSTIVELFFGQQISIIQKQSGPQMTPKRLSLECKKKSDNLLSINLEMFSSLHLPVPESRCHLRDCLDAFYSIERFEGENKYFDEKSGSYMTAEKQSFMTKSPLYLVICLNSHMDLSHSSQVPHHNIDIPLELDFSQYVLGNKDISFSLIAMCHHTGKIDSGHYLASCICKDSTDWIRYNDDEVQRFDSHTKLCDDVCILVFEKKQK